MKGKHDQTLIDAHLQTLRRAELESVGSWFKPNMRVFELGGGSGYQASLIAAQGCEVVSVDLADRSVPIQSYFPVKDYDGKKIPFPDRTFDLVFSSNVLEHVRNLSQILEEIRRVLKPEGLAIRILPSSTWRFWTSLAHYGFALKYIIHPNVRVTNRETEPNPERLTASLPLPTSMSRILWSGPHGNFPNALSELYYFSRRHWKRVFKRHRFEVIQIKKNGVFYTGYKLFCRLPLSTRVKMAKIIGSSCHAYIMRPTPGTRN